MKKLLFSLLLFPVLLSAQNSECIIEVTQRNGVKIMLSMGDLKYVIPEDTMAVIIRGDRFTRQEVLESIDSLVTLAAGELVTFTDAKDGRIKAVAKSFVDIIRENGAGKAVIITRNTRYTFTCEEDYSSVLATFTSCATGGGGGGGIYTGTNVGGGTGQVYKTTVGTTHQFREIYQGTNITVATVGDNVIVSAPSVLSSVSVDSITIGGDGAGDALNLLDGAVTSGKISDEAVTFGKIQDINTNRLLGRYSAGSGPVQEITPGSGLVLAAGVLSSVAGASDTTYDAGNGCWVTANALGVTFSEAGGTGTIVIPAGVRLRYFRINGATADLDGSNNYKVVFNHTGSNANAALASYLPPVVQVINTAATLGGGPSDALPLTYNQGAVPGTQVVGFGSGDLTIRITNLNSYTDWTIVGYTGK